MSTAPKPKPKVESARRRYKGGLAGKLLLAMPGMGDPRFDKAVIFICAHTADGAMGLVVNKPLKALSFPELMQHLNLSLEPDTEAIPLYAGGPVETGRGFVLHTSDYKSDATMPVRQGVGLTATVDILRDIAAGGGPQLSVVALGHTGWGAGQLEQELRHHVWLTCSPTKELLFGRDLKSKWPRAMNRIGATPSTLSLQGGTA